MQALILSLIVSSTLLEFVLRSLGAPALLKLLPEILSVMIAVLVLLAGTRSNFALIAPKYWLAFGCAAFVLLSGILTNGVESGPIIAGIRYYIRAIPLFFVPAVFAFSERQIRQQLGLLLAIGVVQLPIAATQRYLLWSSGHISGDAVQGTLLDSGVLSITLICTTLIVIGFYLRKLLTARQLVLLFFLLLLPTTINETKATVVLLPIGILVTILAGAPREHRLRSVGLAATLLVGFGAVMVPVYDFFVQGSPGDQSLIGFFTSEKQVTSYLGTKKGSSLAQTQNVRRVDAIEVPFDYLAEDPIHLIFGLGIGNATTSNLGESFSGHYVELFRSFVITSFSVFLLEIGVLGTGIVFLLYWLVYRDAVAVARTDPSLLGALAIGWAGAVIVMAISTFYTSTHAFTSLSYLYWYFSGMIAARRVKLTVEARGTLAHAVGAARPSLETVSAPRSSA